ncbi:hypothetical protein C3V43_09095 [Bacteroides heparinolyticus]|nr:hypothetical protein C3V43_09095 [Bacteroides heparinolyticus]
MYGQSPIVFPPIFQNCCLKIIYVIFFVIILKLGTGSSFFAKDGAFDRYRAFVAAGTHVLLIPNSDIIMAGWVGLTNNCFQKKKRRLPIPEVA